MAVMFSNNVDESIHAFQAATHKTGSDVPENLELLPNDDKEWEYHPYYQRWMRMDTNNNTTEERGWFDLEKDQYTDSAPVPEEDMILQLRLYEFDDHENEGMSIGLMGEYISLGDLNTKYGSTTISEGNVEWSIRSKTLSDNYFGYASDEIHNVTIRMPATVVGDHPDSFSVDFKHYLDEGISNESWGVGSVMAWEHNMANNNTFNTLYSAYPSIELAELTAGDSSTTLWNDVIGQFQDASEALEGISDNIQGLSFISLPTDEAWFYDGQVPRENEVIDPTNLKSGLDDIKDDVTSYWDATQSGATLDEFASLLWDGAKQESWANNPTDSGATTLDTIVNLGSAVLSAGTAISSGGLSAPFTLYSSAQTIKDAFTASNGSSVSQPPNFNFEKVIDLFPKTFTEIDGVLNAYESMARVDAFGGGNLQMIENLQDDWAGYAATFMEESNGFATELGVMSIVYALFKDGASTGRYGEWDNDGQQEPAEKQYFEDLGLHVDVDDSGVNHAGYGFMSGDLTVTVKDAGKTTEATTDLSGIGGFQYDIDVSDYYTNQDAWNFQNSHNFDFI